ncbi:hypothetical protein D3C79_711580 [compost metagenome]
MASSIFHERTIRATVVAGVFATRDVCVIVAPIACFGSVASNAFVYRFFGATHSYAHTKWAKQAVHDIRMAGKFK